MAREHLHSFIEDRLPEEVDKAFSSYNKIIKKAWETAESTADDKTRLQALNLVKETFATKLDLVSNVDIINQVMNMARDKPNNNDLDEVQKVAKSATFEEGELQQEQEVGE